MLRTSWSFWRGHFWWTLWSSWCNWSCHILYSHWRFRAVIGIIRSLQCLFLLCHWESRSLIRSPGRTTIMSRFDPRFAEWANLTLNILIRRAVVIFWRSRLWLAVLIISVLQIRLHSISFNSWNRESRLWLIFIHYSSWRASNTILSLELFLRWKWSSLVRRLVICTISNAHHRCLTSQLSLTSINFISYSLGLIKLLIGHLCWCHFNIIIILKLFLEYLSLLNIIIIYHIFRHLSTLPLGVFDLLILVDLELIHEAVSLWQLEADKFCRLACEDEGTSDLVLLNVVAVAGEEAHAVERRVGRSSESV